MSSLPIRPEPPPEAAERRSHPRRRLEQLAYIGFGPDIGGVLLDISEEGLRCQIVGSVVEGDRCHLKFALPGRRSTIEVDGEVVWSNRSKQGGGVRLIGLRPDARQDLQKWIHDEIAAANVRSPVPIPIRTKGLGAVHAPKPSAPAPTAPVSVTKEKAASLPHELTPPVQITRKTAAEAVPVPQSAPPAVTAKKPAPQPKDSTPVASVILLRPEHRSNSVKIAVLVACVIAGVAAFAFSGFNFTSLLSQVKFSFGAVPAIIAPAAPPTVSAPNSPATDAQPAEEPAPDVASEAADHNARSTDRIAALQAAIASPVPVIRPPQNPRPTAPANRPRLALTLPRPRTTNPAQPTVAMPELAAAPPAPLIDMPLLESQSPELPQPARPQVVSNYSAPQLVSRVEPVYSDVARQARLQGVVTVNVTIGADGLPRSSVCVNGNTMLCRMAIEAISKWRYRPAISNGLPVVAQALVSFTFQLR